MLTKNHLKGTRFNHNRTKTKANPDMSLTPQRALRMKCNSLMGMLLHWTLMTGLLLPEKVAIARVAFENDHCETKSQHGICKKWSECPVIKELIERDEYSVQEVVRCGFAVLEEIICCPVFKPNARNIDTRTPTVEITTTAPLIDVRLNVFDDFDSTTTTNRTTTTHKPDIWQELWSRSTMNPLIIGKKRVDKSLSIAKSAKSVPRNNFQNYERTVVNADQLSGQPSAGKESRNIDQWNIDQDGAPIFGSGYTRGAGATTRAVGGPATRENRNIDQWNTDQADGQPIFKPGYTGGHTTNGNTLTHVPPPHAPGAASERPAIRACKRFRKGRHPVLTEHILGGTPVKIGEFPHMVAIGYTKKNVANGHIRSFCGGSLIAERYVLTAAHCLDVQDYVPQTVALGVVDYSDPEAVRNAVAIRIKEKYLHDDYVPPFTYNDIAILELEEAIPANRYIYPVCLYTDEADPDEAAKLWVTGWGIVNTSTKAKSHSLLKAPLYVIPWERCDGIYKDYGYARHMYQGIKDTQVCAAGKDQNIDACQGDSGGPLNFVVDEDYSDYRLLGVVSSGISCGSTTPGLYIRVAKYLDFIERIVWPNGGD